MTEQTEALKMAIEGMVRAEKVFDDIGLILIKFGVKPSDISFHKESFLAPLIQACKEALEQPSVAELNDEYLRDTHVEGLQPAQSEYMVNEGGTGTVLRKPAQEPVAMYENGNVNWINTPKDNSPLYTHPAPSCNGEWSEKIMNQWIDIRKLIADGNTSSYPRDWFESLAPSWQGLSDDEVNDIKTKAIICAKGMSVEQLLWFIVSHTEQALKEKNT